MKACIYTQYGPPEVLHASEIEKPAPKDREILIEVRAAEATKADCEMRSFNFQVKWFWLPLRIAAGIRKPRRPILGGYFAGEIKAVGKNVSKFKKGDKVFGCAQLKMGAYATHVCLPDHYTIIPKPENLTFEEAAAVPLGGLNALHFLRKANVKKGDTVLINGAGGSIGTFAVQIAKDMGAVVTTVDKTSKEKLLRKLGADAFIDYTKESFANNGQTYDVIFDMVVRSDYSACIRSLNPQGRYLIGNPRVSDMLRSVFTSAFTDKKATFVFAGEKEEELRTLKEMIEAGQIRAVIDKVYPLEQAAAAHHRVESEQRNGAIVIASFSTVQQIPSQ